MNPNDPIPHTPNGPAPYVGGILNVLASGYDTYQRHRDVKSEQEARKREAELAYQRSVEMWHMQNAYNTPEQQMARFGAAGLNPNLIYGQGNPGNAGAPPDYHPPEISMQGIHPQLGGSVQTLLPTLMQVGSWMQNMRLTETEIKAKETGMDKTLQLIEYLKQRNPRDLERLDNQLGIFPYQKSAARNIAEKGNLELTDMLEMLRYNWGQEYHGLEFGDFAYKQGGRGKRAVELQKLQAQTRLTGAQADWFEPTTIMKLVMAAALGMGGLGKLAGLGGAAKTAVKYKNRLIPRVAGKASARELEEGKKLLRRTRYGPTR